MPRLIDHAARDAAIAAASFRVLERDGLTGLSVRKVAEETGIAVASLRRSFPTQHALRERCLELVEDRVTERIKALTSTGREWVEEMLTQLLPLDEGRRLELLAQVQLGMLARTDAQLRDSAVRLSRAVTGACEAALYRLAEVGELGDRRDRKQEAVRLRALLDGLAMHGLWTADAISAETLTRTLSLHLDELATPAPSAHSHR